MAASGLLTERPVGPWAVRNVPLHVVDIKRYRNYPDLKSVIVHGNFLSADALGFGIDKFNDLLRGKVSHVRLQFSWGSGRQPCRSRGGAVPMRVHPTTGMTETHERQSGNCDQ